MSRAGLQNMLQGMTFNDMKTGQTQSVSMPRGPAPSFSGSPQKSKAQLWQELKDVQDQLDRATKTINDAEIAEDEIMANNRKLKGSHEATAELEELIQEHAQLEQDLATITKEKEFIQGESAKLQKGIEEIQGSVNATKDEVRALSSQQMAKERTFSLAQDRQNKEIGEVNRDNQRLQEQLDKLDHELSVVNAAIKDVEDDSEVIKNLNEEFTTPSNKGIFDKNQEKLTSRILELNATVSRLQSEAKKAKPKIPKSDIEKAQRELEKTAQRLELEQQSRQASLREKQDLLAEREREKPRLEKIMKDNAKWELRQSEMFFDDLKKEKKEYLYKLEQLNKKVEERKNVRNFPDTYSIVTADDSITAFN